MRIKGCDQLPALNATKRLIPVLMVLVIAALGCGGSSSTPTGPSTPTAPSTPATPVSYDGTWTGSPATSFPMIQLVVRGSAVTSFSITMDALPQVTCTNTITVNPNAPIVNSGFTFSVDVVQQPGNFRGPVAGTFASQTSGSVTLGGTGEVSYSRLVQCGTTVVGAVATRPATIAISRTGS